MSEKIGTTTSICKATFQFRTYVMFFYIPRSKREDRFTSHLSISCRKYYDESVPTICIYLAAWLKKNFNVNMNDE